MDKPSALSRHDDLLRQTFFLLTARFEDAAGIAADGQANGIAADAQLERANRLHAIAQEALILADIVIALIGAFTSAARAVDD